MIITLSSLGLYREKAFHNHSYSFSVIIVVTQKSLIWIYKHFFRSESSSRSHKCAWVNQWLTKKFQISKYFKISRKMIYICQEWHVKSPKSRVIFQEWLFESDMLRVTGREWYVKWEMMRVTGQKWTVKSDMPRVTLL